MHRSEVAVSRSGTALYAGAGVAASALELLMRAFKVGE